MRYWMAAMAVATVGMVSLSANGEGWQHGLGAGAEYAIMGDEVDDCVGGYAYYTLNLPDPVAIVLDLDYIAGDYSVPAGSGTFNTIGLGGGLMLHFDMGDWMPYVGAGAAEHFMNSKGVVYYDKMSIFWYGGFRYAMTDRLSLDASFRYRTLRPDSRRPEIGELNMDAYIIRAGLALDL